VANQLLHLGWRSQLANFTLFMVTGATPAGFTGVLGLNLIKEPLVMRTAHMANGFVLFK
jgi:hypothetical protein